MSRKSIIDDNFAIVDKLKAIEDGKPVSRFLIDKLVGVGYVTMKETRAKGQRGQTSKSFEVSPEGKNLVKQSKTWKRK